MRIKCEQCGLEGEVPQSGEYLCPNCHITVSVSSPESSSETPFPWEPSEGKNLSVGGDPFLLITSSGFVHMVIGIFLGICLTEGRFYSEDLAISILLSGVCGWWGAYLSYRLIRMRRKTFDWAILLSSVLGAVILLLLCGLIPLFLLPLDSSPFKRWLDSPGGVRRIICYFGTLGLVGLYLGSVIGYIGRLLEWKMKQ